MAQTQKYRYTPLDKYPVKYDGKTNVRVFTSQLTDFVNINYTNPNAALFALNYVLEPDVFQKYQTYAYDIKTFKEFTDWLTSMYDSRATVYHTRDDFCNPESNQREGESVGEYIDRRMAILKGDPSILH